MAVPAAKEDKKLANYVDKEVILGIRPEAIHDDEMFLSTATTGVIECDVDITEMMGAENFLYLDCQGTPLTARVDPRSTAKQGDKNLRVALDPNRMPVRQGNRRNHYQLIGIRNFPLNKICS